jgi:hypothetical protein
VGKAIQSVKNDNNIVELTNLSNDDMERVNINKLKEYQHGEPPIVIVVIVVNCYKKTWSFIRSNLAKMFALTKGDGHFD